MKKPKYKPINYSLKKEEWKKLSKRVRAIERRVAKKVKRRKK